jgi:hypothetical protein
MVKKFTYYNEVITITKKKGYGQYRLEGLGTNIHCTESEIWDECDDEESSKCEEVRERAYNILKANLRS